MGKGWKRKTCREGTRERSPQKKKIGMSRAVTPLDGHGEEQIWDGWFVVATTGCDPNQDRERDEIRLCENLNIIWEVLPSASDVVGCCRHFCQHVARKTAEKADAWAHCTLASMRVVRGNYHSCRRFIFSRPPQERSRRPYSIALPPLLSVSS